jgi:pre-mRNA-processing factor SLU7
MVRRTLSYCPLVAVLTGPSVYINNHTAVWGSWYDKSVGEWGYRCCHSTLHISYCAGLAGIEATEASSARQLLGAPKDEGPSSSAKDSSEKEKQAAKIEQNFSKQRVGEGDVALDKEKLERALKEEKKRKKNGYEDDDRYSKKSKGTVESSTHDVTEEQLGEHILFAFFCFQRN